MWTPIQPKFKKECLLLTASKWKDQWHYNSWWIVKCDNMETGGWYWGLCTIDGEEWGAMDELSVDLYKVINIPKP